MNCPLKRFDTIFLLLFVTAAVSGCAATVPTMSEEADTAAERFQPLPGKGNIYVVREGGAPGFGVLFQIDLDGKGRGSIASGTYHLFELQPGRHVVSVSTQENADHETVNVVAGENYFDWNGKSSNNISVASGGYLFLIELNDIQFGRKLILLR